MWNNSHENAEKTSSDLGDLGDSALIGRLMYKFW
jgi:hypothetical protein